jgi:hypothetical protein
MQRQCVRLPVLRRLALLQVSTERDAWKARCQQGQAMLARVGDLLAGKDVDS